MPMTQTAYIAERERHLCTARAYLNEARNRRDRTNHRAFCFLLLQWAANARRRLAALPKPAAPPQQVSLF